MMENYIISNMNSSFFEKKFNIIIGYSQCGN